jgi:hypothetical protein
MKTHKEAVEFQAYLKDLVPFLDVSVVRVASPSLDDEPYGVRMDFSAEIHELIFVKDGQFFKSKNSQGFEDLETPESGKRIIGYSIAFTAACVYLGIVNASKSGFFKKTIGLPEDELVKLAKQVGFVKGLLQKPRSVDMLSAEEQGYCRLWLDTLDTFTQQTLG